MRGFRWRRQTKPIFVNRPENRSLLSRLCYRAVTRGSGQRRWLTTRQNPADTRLENILRGQKADNQERLPFKIKEETGLHQHVVLGQQIQNPFLLALNARRFQNRVPAAFSGQQLPGGGGADLIR